MKNSKESKENSGILTQVTKRFFCFFFFVSFFLSFFITFNLLSIPSWSYIVLFVQKIFLNIMKINASFKSLNLKFCYLIWILCCITVNYRILISLIFFRLLFIRSSKQFVDTKIQQTQFHLIMITRSVNLAFMFCADKKLKHKRNDKIFLNH